MNRSESNYRTWLNIPSTTLETLLPSFLLEKLQRIDKAATITPISDFPYAPGSQDFDYSFTYGGKFWDGMILVDKREKDTSTLRVVIRYPSHFFPWVRFTKGYFRRLVNKQALELETIYKNLENSPPPKTL